MSSFRLQLARSGGFGGVALPTLVLDTGALEPSSADEIDRLIASAVSGYDKGTRDRRFPDAMSYVLTISSDGPVRRLEFDDTTATPDLRRLISLMQSTAGPD